MIIPLSSGQSWRRKPTRPLIQWDATVATLKALGCHNIERRPVRLISLSRLPDGRLRLIRPTFIPLGVRVALRLPDLRFAPWRPEDPYAGCRLTPYPACVRAICLYC
ncbi:hypothetical protein LN650_10310 [Klebsiella pneumoniae subsp. pneumoniae]|nr:hypothetical protein [Klebsiella pneumoniae subsp. pneumoniae]